MKKSLFLITLIAAGAVLATSVWAATTISLSPASVSVNQGRTFNLIISVNPQGIKNYTVKAELKYPADLLEVKSFSFGNNWMALVQPGYDLIDNTNGVLIKTAGYPAGTSSAITFGTVSFLAKKAGKGTIQVGNNSLALDSGNQNVLSSTLAQASVNITAPVSPPAPAPTPTPTPEEAVTPKEEAPVVVSPLTEQKPEAKPSFFAAVGNIISFGTGKVWIAIIVAIVILAIIVYLVFYFTKKARRRKLV
jgi:lipoprotein-anchoring transpeptidase ErfK/SrfK